MNPKVHLRAMVLILALVGCKDGETPSDPATETLDADGDGFDVEDDCNDEDASMHPDATEICDGIDQNCDGEADEGLTYRTFYADADGDGFGDADTATESCSEAPAGFVDDSTDCDDARDDAFPGNEEACDDVDHDCDGVLDNGLTYADYYGDADGDGFGDAAVVQSTCDGAPMGFVSDATDCDDTSAERFPGNTEQCDDIDHDCDQVLDNGLTYTDYFLDDDGDGHGQDDVSTSTCDGAPAGYALTPTDCDDDNGQRFPGNPEVCDGVDNDCDSTPDNGLEFLDYYADDDGDGVGAPGVAATTCDGPPTGHVAVTGDCDDDDPDRFPGHPEICNGLDEDCTGVADDGLVFTEYFPDADNDGYGDPDANPITACSQPDGYLADESDCDDSDDTVYPGAATVDCDFEDRDCNDSLAGLAVPDDYTTVEAAASVANNGDRICVRAGTHDVVGVTLSNGVSLYGEGYDATILESDGTDRVLSMMSGTLEGVSLQGGNHDQGAGLEVRGISTVRGVHIRESTCEDAFCLGTAMYCNDNSANLTLEDVHLYDNVMAGTARAWGAGLNFTGDTLLADGLEVRDNMISVVGDDNRAAGIYVRASTIDISSMQVHSNHIDGTFIVNQDGRGGGVYLDGMGTGATATVVQSDIRNNTMSGIYRASGVGFYAQNLDLALQNTIVAGNLTNASNAVSGVGVFTRNGTLDLDHVVISGNRRTSTNAVSTTGLGLNVENATAFTASNSSIDDNTSQNNLGGGITRTGAAAVFDHVNLWGNTASNINGPDPVGSDGNISANPEYLQPVGSSPLGADFHLTGQSPLADAGAGTDPDGSTADIGAYGGPLGGW